MLGIYASITNNKELMKKYKFQDNVLKRIYDIQTVYHYFTANKNGHWNFQSELVNKLAKMMSREEIERFPLDLSKIEWKKALTCFLTGLRRFYFKEDTFMP